MKLAAIDTNPVREADAMRIAQQFIAGMRRDNDDRSPQSGRLNDDMHPTPCNPSAVRFTDSSETTFVNPAINRWPILDSPLCGLAVAGVSSNSRVRNRGNIMISNLQNPCSAILVAVLLLLGALLNSGAPLPSEARRKTENNTTDLPKDLFVDGSGTKVMNTPSTRGTTIANKIVSASNSTQRVRTGSGSDRIIVNPDPTKKGLARIHDGVPAALANATKTPKANAGKNPLTLTIVLKRDDQQGFDEFLRGVQDPQSPTYRHYLTPREQADRFGPSKKAYDEVSGWLRHKGLRVVEGSANRLTLTVSGTRKNAEEAFGVKIDDYRSGER